MTYVFGISLLVFQIALAVHVVRSGRSFVWIFLILGFPLIGSLIYLIAEVIPEMDRRNTLHHWVMDIQHFINRIFSRW